MIGINFANNKTYKSFISIDKVVKKSNIESRALLKMFFGSRRDDLEVIFKK